MGAWRTATEFAKDITGFWIPLFGGSTVSLLLSLKHAPWWDVFIAAELVALVWYAATIARGYSGESRAKKDRLREKIASWRRMVHEVNNDPTSVWNGGDLDAKQLLDAHVAFYSLMPYLSKEFVQSLSGLWLVLGLPVGSTEPKISAILKEIDEIEKRAGLAD